MNEIHKVNRLFYGEVAAGMRSPFFLLADMQLSATICVKYLLDLNFGLLNCGFIQNYFVSL